MPHLIRSNQTAQMHSSAPLYQEQQDCTKTHHTMYDSLLPYQKLQLATHSAPPYQEQQDCTKTQHTIYDSLVNLSKNTACRAQCPTLSGAATGLHKSTANYVGSARLHSHDSPQTNTKRLVCMYATPYACSYVHVEYPIFQHGIVQRLHALNGLFTGANQEW